MTHQFNYTAKYIPCSSSTAKDTCSATQCCLLYTGGMGKQTQICIPEIGGSNLCNVWGGGELIAEISESTYCTQDSFNNTCTNNCCQKIISGRNSVTPSNPQYLCAPLSFCNGFRQDSFYVKQNIKLYGQYIGVNLTDDTKIQIPMSHLEIGILTGMSALSFVFLLISLFFRSKYLQVVQQIEKLKLKQGKQTPQSPQINLKFTPMKKNEQSLEFMNTDKRENY